MLLFFEVDFDVKEYRTLFVVYALSASCRIKRMNTQPY